MISHKYILLSMSLFAWAQTATQAQSLFQEKAYLIPAEYDAIRKFLDACESLPITEKTYNDHHEPLEWTMSILARKPFRSSSVYAKLKQQYDAYLDTIPDRDWQYENARVSVDRLTNLERLFLETFGSNQGFSELERLRDKSLAEAAKLRLELLDENNEPTAARVTISSGIDVYWPQGTPLFFRAIETPFFFANEKCLLPILHNQVELKVTRGPEYKPITLLVELQPKQEKHIKIRLERWINMNERGWFSADGHTHTAGGRSKGDPITKGYLEWTPQQILDVCSGQGLNVTCLQTMEWRPGQFFHPSWFTGKPHVVSSKDTILAVEEEYRHSTYGHVNFHGLKKLIQPIGPYTGMTFHFPPNTDACVVALGQGAGVTYAHLGSPGLGTQPKGMPMDVALGLVDAVELAGSGIMLDWGLKLWYSYLNAGYRVALAAGSDTFFNRLDRLPGVRSREYVHIPDKRLTYRSWLAAHRKGKSFITRTTMLTFTANDRHIGDTLKFTGNGSYTIRLNAELESNEPMHGLATIIKNGTPLEAVNCQGDRRIAFETTVDADKSCWFALSFRSKRSQTMEAHTNPIHVHFNGKPYVSEDAVTTLMNGIDFLENTLTDRTNGPWNNGHEREHVFELIENARANLRIRMDDSIE